MESGNFMCIVVKGISVYEYSILSGRHMTNGQTDRPGLFGIGSGNHLEMAISITATFRGWAIIVIQMYQSQDECLIDGPQGFTVT